MVLEIPLWTDIAQAILSGGGLFIAALTLAMLYQDNVEQSKKIDKLSGIVEKLNDANELASKQINIQIWNRKRDIMPNLRIESSTIRLNGGDIVLKNTGSKARALSVISVSTKDGVKYQFAEPFNSVLELNTTVTLHVDEYNVGVGLNCLLLYNDQDGNKYQQGITGEFYYPSLDGIRKMGLEISDPGAE